MKEERARYWKERTEQEEEEMDEQWELVRQGAGKRNKGEKDKLTHSFFVDTYKRETSFLQVLVNYIVNTAIYIYIYIIYMLY